MQINKVTIQRCYRGAPMIRFNTSILTPTLTPSNVKTPHIGAIIHYLRTVINVEPTEYIITDVPTRREALAAFLSSVLLSLAALALGILPDTYRCL